ncbi:MAG: extracellular solute-binding protein [Clostridia bacterium]|nr:extracellular solute-binding protein [Clostridia bacterium]
MKKKGIMALIACGVMAAGATLGMAACGNKEKGITIWASSDDQETLKTMIARFKEDNPDFSVPITTGVVGAGDAVSKLSVDVSAGADIYCYANDQVVNLLSYGALSAIPTKMVETLLEENDKDSVESGKVNDKYYGYPYAADNGYFLYYNKAIMSDEDAGSLETILAKCKAAGKTFVYDMETAWYVGAFFLGTAEGCVGGTYDFEYEGTTVVYTHVNFDEKAPGSEYTIGEIGGQALIDLANAKAFVPGGDEQISKDLNGDKNGTWFGACISGTWNAEKIQQTLGENYGTAKLPTFHSSLDGKDYQMGSLLGYKLFGVNPNTKYLEESHQLAAYLMNEQMQELRFDELQTGPSNKKVAQLEKVQKNAALAAIIAQTPYATPQGAIPTSYWDAMKQFGANVKGKTVTSATLKEDLETFIKGFEKDIRADK